MANPRKFSEKIALLNQKEAEGNAEFERIMREVSEVSSKVSQAPPNTNLIAATSAFISRSLPNVNAPITDTNKITDNEKEGEPTTTLAGLLTTGYSNDITKNGTNSNTSRSSSRESRGRSPGGGPIRSRNRNIDTSPYSSTNNAYLSPPDSSWRRTSSDSAIHQSLTQAQDTHNNVNSLTLSPRAQKRLLGSQSNSMKDLHFQQQHPNMNHNNNQQNLHQHTFNQHQSTMVQQQILNQQSHLILSNLQQDNKTRSHSRLPGINIYPSQNNDTLQIPVGNSTGSLPDLTLVHFQQSPISTPLDLENEQIITVGSFNPNSFSLPMEISTNQTNFGQQQIFQQIGQQNQQQQRQQNQNHGNFNGKHFNNNSNNNNANSNSNNNITNKVSTSSQGFQQGSNHTTFAQQSSPIPIDRQQQHSPLQNQSYPSNQISAEKLMSYRNVNAASPANLSSSQGNLSKSYQSSPHNRPSPGSSPNNLSTNFDSNSSAPCSPSSAGGNNGQFETFTAVSGDNYYMSPSIQQHFEQFSLIDSSPNDYITSANEQNYSQMNENFNNGFSDESPNRQSPTTSRSRTSSQSNGKSSNSNNRSNNHSSNGAGSPHSPLSNDSMLTSGSNYDNNVNCDNLRNNIILGSVGLSDDLLNGSSVGNGINDIMFGAGIGGSDNKSNIGTLPTSLMMSQTSPSHNLNNVQTPTSIPSIVFSDYSCEQGLFLNDDFLELGTNELQMFENAPLIDPTVEDSFRRDLC